MLTTGRIPPGFPCLSLFLFPFFARLTATRPTETFADDGLSEPQASHRTVCPLSHAFGGHDLLLGTSRRGRGKSCSLNTLRRRFPRRFPGPRFPLLRTSWARDASTGVVMVGSEVDVCAKNAGTAPRIFVIEPHPRRVPGQNDGRDETSSMVGPTRRQLIKLHPQPGDVVAGFMIESGAPDTRTWMLAF